jgi:hypothetical protein
MIWTLRGTLVGLVVAVLAATAPCSALAQAPAATRPAVNSLPMLLKPEGNAYTSRPAYGCKIDLHWQAVPLQKNLPIVIDVVDGQGQKVASEQWYLNPDTSKWSGAVEVSRWLCLPEFPPKNKKTGPPLTEGQYNLWLHLGGDNAQGVSEPIAAGPGLSVDGHNHVHIGTLTIEADAPLPVLGPKTLDLTGYRMTFHDEFDDLSVSARGPCGEGPGQTRWMAHTPYDGDFGDAKFVDSAGDFPFSVHDGVLTIQVRKTGKGWQGGLLSSADPQGHGFAQKFGYFEMRAQLPKGTGTWPAFWLLGVDDLRDKTLKTKTTGIEIDVLEQYGHWPNKLCTTTHLWHVGGTETHEGWGEGTPVVGMTSGFHNYGVMIDEKRLTYYYDGIVVRSEPTPEAAKVPLYVLVNLTLGPGWPLDKTPSPCNMLVDYVHVYAKQ